MLSLPIILSSALQEIRYCQRYFQGIFEVPDRHFGSQIKLVISVSFTK